MAVNVLKPASSSSSPVPPVYLFSVILTANNFECLVFVMRTWCIYCDVGIDVCNLFILPAMGCSTSRKKNYSFEFQASRDEGLRNYYACPN